MGTVGDSGWKGGGKGRWSLEGSWKNQGVFIRGGGWRRKGEWYLIRQFWKTNCKGGWRGYLGGYKEKKNKSSSY